MANVKNFPNDHRRAKDAGFASLIAAGLQEQLAPTAHPQTAWTDPGG